MAFSRLERLAALIAIETTLEPKHSTVYVRSQLVKEIREELTDRGFNWRDAQKRARVIAAEESKKRVARERGSDALHDATRRPAIACPAPEDID